MARACPTNAMQCSEMVCAADQVLHEKWLASQSMYGGTAGGAAGAKKRLDQVASIAGDNVIEAIA